MTRESEKYEKLVKILRKSKPDLKGIELIEENIINQIRRTQNQHKPLPDLVENLFGWIYIRWVRRSLVTASVFLVLFFVYQQTMILKGVNNISKQTIVNGNGTFSVSEEDFGKQLMIYRFSGRKFPSGDLEISDRQVKEILDSYNELQDKYSDLIKIIEEDSVLKVYIEKKLAESKNRGKKTNL